MDNYSPDHFENKPEKGFWQTKILDRATELAAEISENFVVQHVLPKEEIKDGPTDFIVLQHSIHQGPYIAFGFTCSQEYFEEQLDDTLKQNAKTLYEDINVLFN